MDGQACPLSPTLRHKDPLYSSNSTLTLFKTGTEEVNVVTALAHMYLLEKITQIIRLFNVYTNKSG